MSGTFLSAALGWFETAFTWIYDNLINVELFGINIPTVILSLLVASLAFRYFVMPLLGGSFSIGRSDTAADSKNDDKDREILQQRYGRR